MNIAENKYPVFWKLLKKNINKENINDKLTCPMNYLYNLNISKYRDKTSTLPMLEFFISHPLEKDKKQCKKVEELISNYSLGMLDYHIDNNIYDYSSHLLLRSDFDELLDNISNPYFGKSVTTEIATGRTITCLFEGKDPETKEPFYKKWYFRPECQDKYDWRNTVKGDYGIDITKEEYYKLKTVPRSYTEIPSDQKVAWKLMNIN